MIQLNAVGVAFKGRATQKAMPEQPGSVATKEQQAGLRKQLRSTSAAFMENKGQWDKQALYLSQTPSLNLWVTKDGLRSEYYGSSDVKGQTIKKGQVIDMAFVGGNTASHKGIEKLPTITQFIKPEGTTTVRSYREAKLASVYPGIDMRLYTEGERPRYDLVAAAGSKPEAIKLKFRGADSVRVEDGNLVLGTKEGLLEHRDLYAYQIKGGKKVQVPAAFVKVGKDEVKFALGAYDKSQALIIDPIVYGTFYGGDSGIDEVRGVASDADAGIYFTGSTQAPDFPILFGPFSVNITGASDTFLAKLRGDAYVHEYSAYIGGGGRETGKFIGLDPTGTTVWIVGTTSSNNFPGTAGSLQPALAGTSDTFLISFVKNASTVLAHSYSTYYGGTGAGETLTGFAIAPITGDLVLSGHSDATVPGAGAPPGAVSHWVTRLNNLGTVNKWSKFYGGTATQNSGFTGGLVVSLPAGGRVGVVGDGTSNLTGYSVAVDPSDNVLITGTVSFTGNQNTATAPTPGFPTTAGVYPTGRLLRNVDVYVAKFNPTGTVIYAALLGGANDDFGSSIATDENGNAYVTGVAASADFPRTNGTYGQVFTSASNVFVTKISTDGSQLVYSTNLRTSGMVWPLGIAVNQRGFAFITGIVDCAMTFSDPPGMPGDPNLPITSNSGGIQVTPDALRLNNTFPAIGDMPATDGFLNIIDSTAENLLYGTYVGGKLDDVSYAPYVDRVGDVWVMGYSESARIYQRVSTQGVPTPFVVTDGGLDANFITPLAFKSVIENPQGPGQTTFNGMPYGSRYSPFTNTQTINMSKVRDGYLFRFRLDIPIVTDLALAPSSIAGGLGQTSTGTVTISGPAPAEGVECVVSLDSTTAASFDPTNPVGQTTVTIAPGATTGTFTVFSREVIDPVQVQVKAEFLGSFKIRQLTVNPWLSQLTLTPTTVPSGKQSTGRVTMFTTATEDMVIALSTDTPDLISFPGGSTVTVPAGQQAVNFPIQTSTVDTLRQGNVSASFLARTRTQVLAVKKAALESLAFVPGRVAGASASTGTVTLDGNAPSTGAVVDIAVTAGNANIATFPAQVTVPANQRTVSFQVVTNQVLVNTSSTFTATYDSLVRQAFLLIDNISLTNFTINPGSVNGGGTVTGTIVVSQPAPPGGVFVNVTTNPFTPSIILPDDDPNTPGNQVLVAANNTSRNFTIGTFGVLATETAHIEVSRGSGVINKPLIINPVNFGMVINPASVLGGQSATMTITLTGPAPTGGVPFVITKTSYPPNGPDNSGAITVNNGNPVIIPFNQTVGTFPLTTVAVAQTDTVKITATIAASGFNQFDDLEVRAPRATSLTFTPSVVRGLFVSTMRVTLDGPAPAGGANVTITRLTQPQIVNTPSSVMIPAGQTFVDTVVTTNKVSRSIASNVQATYGGGSAASTITVTR